MINRDVFFETYCGKERSYQKAYTERLLNTFEEKTQGKDVYELLSSKDFLISLFWTRIDGRSSQAAGAKKMQTVGRTSYVTMKTAIANIADYYKAKVEIPSYQEVIRAGMLETLFPSISSVIELIDRVGAYYVPRYSTSKHLLYIKTLVVLSWNGLTADQMTNIKKADIGTSNIVVGDRTISLSKAEMKIVHALADAFEDVTLPNGRLVRYGETEFLIPTRKKGQTTVDESSLRGDFSRFNEFAFEKGEHKQLSFVGLKQSGIFERIHRENVGRPIKTIKEVTDCGSSMLRSIEQNYNLWLTLLK